MRFNAEKGGNGPAIPHTKRKGERDFSGEMRGPSPCYWGREDTSGGENMSRFIARRKRDRISFLLFHPSFIGVYFFSSLKIQQEHFK